MSAPSRSAVSRPVLNAIGETPVRAVRHHVVDAELAGHLDRAVGAAVVDDEPLDDVDPRQLARQVGERRRQRRLLVEARDLDHELHLDRSLRLRRRATEALGGYRPAL